MFRTVVMRALLGAALIITVPAAAAAQERPTTPEGTTWHLVSWADAGDLTQVPWYVDATLVLEDGQASGSAACNRFFASYALDGDSLTFSEAGHTLVGCGKAYAKVETGYMAAFPKTVTWARDTGTTDVSLYLYDDTGAIILTYAQAVASLTEADIFALSRQCETMRDRIKKLEAQVKQLKDR